MQEGNKIKQPLLIVSIALAVLFIMSFIKFNYLFEDINFTIHNIDLLSDIKTEPADEQQYNFNNREEQQNAKFLTASVIDFSIDDFIKAVKDNANYPPPAVQGKRVPITGNTKQLSYFFSALKNVKTNTVRIAHYGDSIIEGDLVTADIREALQSKFGGNGVGWLGIVTQDVTFRMTTKHSFSQGNWETGSIYTSNPHGVELGISGEGNVPQGNAWVEYRTTTARRYLRDFKVAKLFYSDATNSQIQYSFDESANKSAQLTSGPGVHELDLSPNGKAKSIKITFPVSGQGTFYGVSLENEPGLYMDNFPLRGNSGVDLQQIKVETLKQFAKFLDYKLIILEFGLNIAGARADYSWYSREMEKVIDNFKAAFPKTSIIMVSVHDKAMRKGSGFVTDPSVVRLLETQKDIAKQKDVAIWSLFDAMGGENSMPSWVNANPPLAFKDYVHFNDQGAKKVAQLLTESLLDEYNKYR